MRKKCYLSSTEKVGGEADKENYFTIFFILLFFMVKNNKMTEVTICQILWLTGFTVEYFHQEEVIIHKLCLVCKHNIHQGEEIEKTFLSLYYLI